MSRQLSVEKMKRLAEEGASQPTSSGGPPALTAEQKIRIARGMKEAANNFFGSLLVDAAEASVGYERGPR